jgi:hypothetical protein
MRSGSSNWCRAGFVSARFGIASMRHQLQHSHGDAVRNLIGRVAMIEMVGPVLTRALQPFTSPPLSLSAHKSKRAACQLLIGGQIFVRGDGW